MRVVVSSCLFQGRIWHTLHPRRGRMMQDPVTGQLQTMHAAGRRQWVKSRRPTFLHFYQQQVVLRDGRARDWDKALRSRIGKRRSRRMQYFVR